MVPIQHLLLCIPKTTSSSQQEQTGRRPGKHGVSGMTDTEMGAQQGKELAQGHTDLEPSPPASQLKASFPEPHRGREGRRMPGGSSRALSTHTLPRPSALALTGFPWRPESPRSPRLPGCPCGEGDSLEYVLSPAPLLHPPRLGPEAHLHALQPWGPFHARWTVGWTLEEKFLRVLCHRPAPGQQGSAS